MYNLVFSKISAYVIHNYKMDNEVSTLPVSQLTEKQLETRKSKMEASIVANRLALFVASKLRSYQVSKIGVIADVLSILGVVIVTTMALAWINFALYKIDTGPIQIYKPAFILYFFVL